MTIKRILGIFCLTLLVFAFIFSAMTHSGYCLGDSILRSIGFKAWSKESTELTVNGFHNTLLFSFALAVLGYIGVKHYLKSIYPRLVNSLPFIVIILCFTSNLLFSWGYGIVLSFSKGVNAVDYFPAQSNCNYTLDPANSEISYSYQIALKNYSDDTVKFNMQVQKPSYNNSINMSYVITLDAQRRHTLKEFILEPKEEEMFQFTIKNPDNKLNSINSIQRPKIIIFDGKNSKEFKAY